MAGVVKDMQAYGNESGNGGVAAYQIGDEEIVVRFVDGRLYRYTYTRPGKVLVEQMKMLAISGRGLTTFINQHVRDKYAEKLS